MNSFLDWLDEAAGAFIRLAYLVAGITAVAVYFGAGALPVALDAYINAGLPWVLAAAVETHTYLTSRRVRVAWQERNWHGLWVNLAVLAVLLAFSAWNQLGYLSGSWKPPHAGPFALPTWAAYVVRADFVPVAFMLAAFLAPLAAPIAMQIEQEARNVLVGVFKIARKQRKRMLKEAQKSGRDLTGALVELVGDADTRRIIAHAYGAIRPAEAGLLLAAPESSADYSAEAAMAAVARELHIVYPPHIEASAGVSGDCPPEPPGGGGLSASAASEASFEASAGNVTPLRRVVRRVVRQAPRQPRRTRRDASRANARSGRRGRAEQRVRAVLAQLPLMSHAELVKRTKLSPSTVSKWLRVIEAERLAERVADGIVELDDAGRTG